MLPGETPLQEAISNLLRSVVAYDNSNIEKSFKSQFIE